MAERPLYTLYKNLKAQNYDVPDDYNKFESALTRDGKGGADNRHAIYENLKAQNFDVPDTYERFYSALFEPRSKTSSRAKGGSVPMTAADRARFSAGAASISASAQQTMNNAGRYNRLKQRKQKHQKDFGRVNLGTHQTPFGGDANNVVKDDFAYNPETGKAGAYVTSDNDNVYSQNDAEQKQNLLDKYGEEWNNAVDMGIVPSELDKADPDLSDTDVAMRQMERRQEWLNENQDRRSNELNESMHLQGSPFVASGGAVAPSSFNTAISNEANRLSDVEYGAYNTAKAYNQMLRTTLLQELKEQKQRNENAGWWKDKWNDVSNYFGAMFNTMLDPKLYSQGVMDAAISNNLLQVKKGMEDGTIKKGSNAGNAAQAMLGAIQQQQGEAAKQQQYGTKAYQYGYMNGRSLKFMADFASSGWRNVMTTGFTKAGEKVGEKMALGALGKWFTKNTGRVLGDIAGSAALAATNQLGSTYNNVIERYVGMNNENGGVTQDKNGDLKFNEGVSLGKAIKDGFGSATIENFSEMFGEYLPGAPKLLSKLGLSKVSSFFEKIGNNAYYKWLSNATNKSGIQGVMAEISEEEFGTALHAAWGDGDGSWSDFNVFTNPDAREKQIDTCLGMFYSVGFMQAPRTAVGAINAVQYFNIKHQVAKADKFGQMMFNDKWDEIKSKIDVTTNADLTKTVLDATRSDSMTAKQKDAVINYAMFLSKLRGFNQAADAKTKDKVEEGDTAPTLSNDIDDAYTEGHNADDTDKHNIQLEQNDKANELAAMLHITPEQLHDMADEDLETMTGQNDKLDQAIYDYQVSTAKYQGVMDGAQDEVDMAAQQAAMETDNMTDLSRGTVRKATIKATGGLEDYEVYIISGNIATHDDGSIDVGNSDDMIIYYDPTTGRKEHADAMMFADLIEELPAADVKAQAINDAKENAIKKIAGIIDGTVEVGSQFSVTDVDGTEHTYEVLADNGDGTAMITIDGNVPTELVKGENVQIPYSFADLQQMKDAEDLKRLEAAKTEREQMEKERAAQQTEQTLPSFDFKEILNDNGNVVEADVIGKDGNSKFPNSKIFLIRNTGAKAKVVELKSDGTLKSHAVNKEDVQTATSMSLEEYKQARFGSSMIEDNSGENRGEIEAETPIIEDAEPIGTGAFGNIYNQFKGKVKEAFNFLMSHKSGDLLGVFHRDDVGDIDLVWGNEKMGLAHILGKHVGEGKDFETPDDAIAMIENVINSGRIFQDNQNRYTLMLDGVGVGIRKSFDGEKKNWIVTAVDFNRSQEEKGIVTNPTSTSHGVTESESAAALNDSDGKDINNSANGNENNESLTFEDGTPIPVDENGETDLSQTDAAHAAEWYDNNLGEDADDWLDGEIKKAKKVLEQAQNKKVTGTKPSELVASKKEKEAAIADAKAHYDSAISIRDSLKERRIAKKENTAEGRKNLIEKARRKFARLKSAVNNDAEAVAQIYKETVGTLLHRLYDGTGIDVTDTIPLTAEEYVASNLGAHSLNYEGTETSKGVKQETGLSREDFAKTQLLAADGKGTTIDALVHSLWENRPSNLDSLDTQDIRNALLSIITSGFKASEARNYIENLRIAQAENILEEQKKAADNAAFAEEQKAKQEEEDKKAEENEKINEQNKFPDKLREGSNAVEVPEDATDEKPLGEQRTKSPFLVRENGKQQTETESDADVEKNKVDDIKVVDNIVGKKTRKTLEKIAKIMGANIQWLYSNKQFNGKFDEKTNTIYLTLDSSITEGVQFIFGHEMTHEMRTKNPAAYDELKTLVKDMMGEDIFSTETDKMQERYKKGGARYWNNRDAIEEEVVADQLGKWIRDANYAHTLLLKMSHPLLARLHEIVNRFLMALHGTEFSDDMNLILRSIEQAYVKTANGQVTNSETGEDVSFSLRDMADGKESGAADMAEDLKSLNTPDEVDNAIKTAIDDMPSGWKMANKKMIHIAQALGENRKAEIAGEEPKFSLKDGSLIKAGTYFSGGGLVEEGLKGIIDPVVAVEYDEKISGVYRNNFGQHIVTADVRDVDPKELVEQIDGEVEYFHASPVCKNYSQAKSNHAEVELDKETAASTAEFINAVKPKVVTIENVKGYKDSDAMKIITDALDANGYNWDADVYNAADYGGYSNRERLIVRAVRDGKLPAKPKKMAHKSGWYEAVADIIPTLTEKKNGVAPWMDVRLKADGIDWRNIDKPLYVMGSAYADGKVPHAFADELLPTLRTKSGDVIVMPDGKVYRAMGRVLARVSGVSDDYKMPFSENLSHTIIGNGIPTQLTEHVIAPLLTGSDPKFSIRTYHGTGASFDKFDFSHMGEGEGSQAFGWGGYVTNSKEIAEDYTRRAKMRKDNGGFEFVTDLSDSNKDMVRHYIYKYKDVNKGLDAMRKDLSSALEMFPDDDNLKELSDILAKKNEEIAVPDDIAYLYDVDIPDDNGDYLDWENKLKKSHLNKVNKELVRIGKEPIETIYPSRVDGKVRGQDLYDELSSMLGSKEAASKLLSDAGFVGIKYPAGTIFGGAKKDDYNYVIFDENNANIVGNTRFSLRYDQFEHDLNQWKKDNNLPKDAQRPTIPQRNAGESAVDFLRRVDEYRKQMALWKTAPTYEQHLLSDDTALGEFNRELQKGSVLKRIAFQDSMLAIRKAQEAIMKEVGVDRLNMAEDAYTAENRSHGKGKNEFEEYNNEFLQPLRKAYHQMKKILGDSYDNVRIYMMAKHGLERDAQMAFKKSLDADFEDVAQRSAAYRAYKGDMNRITNDSDLEFGRVDFNIWRQRDNALRTKYSPSYMDYRYDENGIAYDYSGLSALFGGSDFEEAAHKLVRDIESSHVAEVQDLWNATNAATKKILRDGYKAGMMSKDTYQYVRDMYSHYIPLRGWDGTTADQVWDYVGGGNGAFNQTLKTAHGRTSIANDPIAYIENMAESGILLNNKNWVKQHLMLLAQNHPTSLLTLSKAWYVKSTDANGNEEWIPATPQITSQMNSNQVKAAIDAFEKKMEKMAQTGDATQQRDGLNIVYPQTHSEEREHEVRVMKDGEEYVIYVNGDPQLAQAMNNTRAHRVREIQSGKLDRAAAWLGRKMAAAYTSLSPLFIPSNYFRDLTMTLASTAIREDGRYNYLLRKNLATSWNLGFMLRDYQSGKLREKISNGNATPKEQMFYDFMMNGGETGFVSSLDVEDLKKKFKNDLKDLDRWKTNPVKVGHTIMDGIEFLNRAIEDSNRFAVYMTSIQYGRSIDEAVNDAKDVTLNFNRKGTGEYGWQMIRNLYLFINPAVQSLQTLGALAKHHPFKFTAVTASWLTSGVLVPIVNAALMSLLGGDDDKDKYWQFTKWDRRNNLIMWVPFTHEYVKIPLAQEFRAFYGVGDMIASKIMGGELAEESWSQYAEDLLGQVVDMLPLDPTGYDGNIAVSLMPNAIRPVFELAFNVDFTGKPLFKDTEYNKYDPNFTKAYVGTPDWLVRASRMVNSIGNDYPDVQQNSIDAFGDPRYNLNNPAVVDHVLSSYLGGAYTMGSQVLGLLTKSLNDPKEIKMADIPLFSKFVSNPDDRPVTKKQGDEFWNMKENHDRAANTLSKLKKQAKVDGDYSMLERFYDSEEYKQYKQDDVKVKKYEEDRKKERAEESGEEYRPHKLNAEDIYKAHATPKDDFEDLKLKQLYTKLNGFKSAYDLLVDTAPSQSDGYYNTNKAAIDAIDEISLDKQEISELKKGFLDDGKDAYNAEDMKQIRDLRKKILAVLEKANKVVVANQKAKAGK